MSAKRRLNVEKASWIAGIIGAGVAVVALVITFAAPEDQPVSVPVPVVSVEQQAGSGSTQIGQVNGNVFLQNPDHAGGASPEQSSISGEFPVPKIYGLSYDDARTLLIQSGWIPAKNHWTYGQSPEVQSGNGPVFWERGYFELDACSGTGAAYCLFKFFDPSRRALLVTTEGEESELGEHHAKVARYSIQAVEDDST